MKENRIERIVRIDKDKMEHTSDMLTKWIYSRGTAIDKVDRWVDIERKEIIKALDDRYANKPKRIS